MHPRPFNPQPHSLHSQFHILIFILLVINSETAKTTLWRYAGLMAYNFNSIRWFFEWEVKWENYRRIFAFEISVEIDLIPSRDVRLNFPPVLEKSPTHSNLCRFRRALQIFTRNFRISFKCTRPNWLKLILSALVKVCASKNAKITWKHFFLSFQSSAAEKKQTHTNFFI